MVEQYPCDSMCMAEGKMLPAQRKQYRCALPDFSDAAWESDERPTHKHMGALPILNPTIEDLNNHRNPRRPDEDHAEGCPGSWYRCGFVRSLVKYSRHMTEDGGFSSNLLLDRCHDPLIIEAIHYMENERLRCRSADNERRYGNPKTR